MISAQTLRLCRERKPLHTHRVKPEGMLFRIMRREPLQKK
jgi:hypothetical protein